MTTPHDESSIPQRIEKPMIQGDKSPGGFYQGLLENLLLCCPTHFVSQKPESASHAIVVRPDNLHVSQSQHFYTLTAIVAAAALMEYSSAKQSNPCESEEQSTVTEEEQKSTTSEGSETRTLKRQVKKYKKRMKELAQDYASQQVELLELQHKYENLKLAVEKTIVDAQKVEEEATTESETEATIGELQRQVQKYKTKKNELAQDYGAQREQLLELQQEYAHLKLELAEAMTNVDTQKMEANAAIASRDVELLKLKRECDDLALEARATIASHNAELLELKREKDESALEQKRETRQLNLTIARLNKTLYKQELRCKREHQQKNDTQNASPGRRQFMGLRTPRSKTVPVSF